MATAFKQKKNNAYSTLLATINNSVGTFSVAAGEGSRFPATASGSFWVSIDSETMLCTARAGDVFTVTRAQDGTSATSHTLGATVQLRVVKGHLEEIETAVNTAENDIDTLQSDVTAHTSNTTTAHGVTGAVVGTTNSQTLTNKTLTTPTLTTPQVDTINEKTSANGVTIDSLNIKDGKLNTNDSVVAANITNGAVTINKINLGPSTATVATLQTTTSTTYVDLSTAGPSVTVTIGANKLALVTISCRSYNSNSGTSNMMSFAVSGANTIAASNSLSLWHQNATATAQHKASYTILLSLANTGSTTFTAKYQVGGGTGTFVDRDISVIPL